MMARLATETPPPRGPPLFRFGAIADVQYADCDDGTNFSRTVTRYFRHSLIALRQAVECWAAEDVAFVAQLGDLVDGRNAYGDGSAERTAAALEAVRTAFATLPADVHVHNCVGNHELMVFPRGTAALDSLAPPIAAAASFPAAAPPATGRAPTYRTWSPHAGWRCVLLDPYWISTLGWKEGEHTNADAAWALLDAHNPNDCRVLGTDFMIGLAGLEQRWMPYNGSHGSVQLAWLEVTLRGAAAAGEKVIVLTHVAVGPGACYNDCLAWDYEEVLAILHGAGSGAVVAVLSGHDHRGGYAMDDAGVHHLTLRAPLETPPPDPCHAVIEVHADALVVKGYGREVSRVLAF